MFTGLCPLGRGVNFSISAWQGSGLQGVEGKLGPKSSWEPDVKDAECCAQKSGFYSLDIPGNKH